MSRKNVGTDQYKMPLWNRQGHFDVYRIAFWGKGYKAHVEARRRLALGKDRGMTCQARVATVLTVAPTLYIFRRQLIDFIDYFGRGENDVMKRLRGLRHHARTA